MTTSEFIAEFAEILGVPAQALTPETDLRTMPSWDSVAWLSSQVLIDGKMGATLRPEVLANAHTLQDILRALELELQG